MEVGGNPCSAVNSYRDINSAWAKQINQTSLLSSGDNMKLYDVQMCY